MHKHTQQIHNINYNKTAAKESRCEIVPIWYVVHSKYVFFSLHFLLLFTHSATVNILGLFCVFDEYMNVLNVDVWFWFSFIYRLSCYQTTQPYIQNSQNTMPHAWRIRNVAKR